jgi:Ca2+-binding RTX toxin-like protein
VTIITLTEGQINTGLRTPGAALGGSQFTFSISNGLSTWSAYAPGSEPFSDYGTLSGAQAAHFRTAVARWDELIAPSFSEITETASTAGELRVAFTTVSFGAGFAYSGVPQPPGGKVGDIWIDHLQAGNDFSPGLANGLYETFIHEIGHTLGLKHPFEAPVIPTAFDNQRFTVMSYTEAGNYVSFSGTSNSIFSRIAPVANISPMVLDIAAVQAIYGVDTTTRTGDTVYRFDQSLAVLQSIYDSGGNDTFDLSDFTRPNIIDLRPGAYSSLGLFSLADQIAYWSAQFPVFGGFITDTLSNEADLFTFTDNVGIALSVTIENAIGGSQHDQIIGNAAVNRLYGNAGNDLLNGSTDADLLYGGTGNDTYYVDVTADLVFENPGEGDDLVIATNSFYLYADIENLLLAASSGDIFGVGNAADNSITGNEGKNLLIGGGGNDTIFGGAGIDSLFGEAGNDTLNGDAGIDYLVGGAGNDTLNGNGDADALYGEDGDDTLIGGSDFQTDILVGGNGNDTLDGASGLGDYDLIDGGAGNDAYRVDTPDDLTFEAIGGGTDTIFANIVGAGYYLYPNTENLVLEGVTPFGVGNELANQLTGNSIGNYLLGGLGADSLNGKAGNDVLFGEGGADTFVFERGTGGDVIGDFQAGVDKISLTGLGFANYAALQPNIFQVGGNTGINLGFGDFIVLNGVTNAQLSATDFIFG